MHIFMYKMHIIQYFVLQQCTDVYYNLLLHSKALDADYFCILRSKGIRTLYLY